MQGSPLKKSGTGNGTSSTLYIAEEEQLPPSPKLSVCIISYQQGNYIEQALESVLMQKCNYPYEIIVGDDASDDGTETILLQYQKQHPDKFRLLMNKTNMGVMPNLVQVINKCKGTYIAFLEADDYWHDENKIQHQLHFLESNPAYVAHFTDYSLVDTTGEIIEKNAYPETIENSLNTDPEKYITMHLRTLVFRKDALSENEIQLLRQFDVGDVPLSVFLITKGLIKFSNTPTASYRITKNGIYTSLNYDKKLSIRINTYQKLLPHIIPSKRKILRNLIYGCYNSLAMYNLAKKNLSGFLTTYFYNLRNLKYWLILNKNLIRLITDKTYFNKVLHST